MSKSKTRHTPGPWSVQSPSGFNIPGRDANYLCILKPLDNGETCFIGRANLGLEYGDVFANAKLMAAAPELLEALEKVMAQLEWLKRDKVWHGVDKFNEITRDQNRAEDAITKARGGVK
jgi:hypothetical protein